MVLDAANVPSPTPRQRCPACNRDAIARVRCSRFAHERRAVQAATNDQLTNGGSLRDAGIAKLRGGAAIQMSAHG